MRARALALGTLATPRRRRLLPADQHDRRRDHAVLARPRALRQVAPEKWTRAPGGADSQILVVGFDDDLCVASADALEHFAAALLRGARRRAGTTISILQDRLPAESRRAPPAADGAAGTRALAPVDDERAQHPTRPSSRPTARSATPPAPDVLRDATTSMLLLSSNDVRRADPTSSSVRPSRCGGGVLRSHRWLRNDSSAARHHRGRRRGSSARRSCVRASF